MRRVCAWCRQPMGEPAESGEVTHGICDECYRRVMVEVESGSEAAGVDESSAS